MRWIENGPASACRDCSEVRVGIDGEWVAGKLEQCQIMDGVAKRGVEHGKAATHDASFRWAGRNVNEAIRGAPVLDLDGGGQHTSAGEAEARRSLGDHPSVSGGDRPKLAACGDELPGAFLHGGVDPARDP